jgi:hypothetical protein
MLAQESLHHTRVRFLLLVCCEAAPLLKLLPLDGGVQGADKRFGIFGIWNRIIIKRFMNYLPVTFYYFEGPRYGLKAPPGVGAIWLVLIETE